MFKKLGVFAMALATLGVALPATAAAAEFGRPAVVIVRHDHRRRVERRIIIEHPRPRHFVDARGR